MHEFVAWPTNQPDRNRIAATLHSMAAPRKPRHDWAAHVQRVKADLAREERLIQTLPDEGPGTPAMRMLEVCHQRVKLAQWILDEAAATLNWQIYQYRTIKERLKLESPHLENFTVDQMATAELNASVHDPQTEMYAEAEQLFELSLECVEQMELEHDGPGVLFTMLDCYDGLRSVYAHCLEDEAYEHAQREILDLRKRLLSYHNDPEQGQREIAEELRACVGHSSAPGSDEFEQARKDLSEAHAIYRQLVLDYPDTAENVLGLLETLVELNDYFPPDKNGEEYTQRNAAAAQARAAMNHLRAIGNELPEHEDLLAELNESMAGLD